MGTRLERRPARTRHDWAEVRAPRISLQLRFYMVSGRFEFDPSGAVIGTLERARRLRDVLRPYHVGFRRLERVIG